MTVALLNTAGIQNLKYQDQQSKAVNLRIFVWYG